MSSEFPPNSKTSKRPVKAERPKKVEQVTQSTATRRKKPMGKRFVETFIGGGDGQGVWNYVFFDVMIPAARDLVVDAGQEALQRAFYGDSSQGRRRAGQRASSIYHNAHSRTGGGLLGGGRPDPRGGPSRRARAQHDFDEIILDTRVEGDAVIDGLIELIEAYEVATVKDLYELVGVDASYVDEKWGWDDLRGASVSRTKGGYLLDLPKPQPLD